MANFLSYAKRQLTYAPPPMPRATHAVRTHFIMRHFAKSELDNERLGVVNFGPYDGFVYNRQYIDAATDNYVQGKIASGIRAFLYYSMLDFPFKIETIGSGPWFDWFRNQVQFGGPVARILRDRSGQTVVALFRYFCKDTVPKEYRELVDWSAIDLQTADAMRGKIFSLSPNCHIFFDMTWYKLYQWMLCDQTLIPPQGLCGACVSGHGSGPSSSPVYNGATWAETISGYNQSAYRTNLLDYLVRVGTALAASDRYALKNGEVTADTDGKRMPEPRFFENSGLFGAIDPTKLAEWRRDTRSVLEIKIPEAPDPLGPDFEALKNAFRTYGGWVAVNSVGDEGADGTNMQEAYRQLAQVQAEVSA